MKKTILLLLTCLIAGVAFNQTKILNGKVINVANGEEIPFANIKSSSGNIIAFADSTGKFSIPADSSSKLIITSVGYEDAITGADNSAVNLIIKLIPTTKEIYGVTVKSANQKIQQNLVLQRAFAEGDLYFTKENSGILGNRSDFSGLINDPITGRPTQLHIVTDYTPSRFSPNATVTEVHTKEDTEGSPYFFKSWVKGIVIDTANNVINDNDSWYNYDKTTGDLIMTKDFKNGMHVSASALQFFILLDSLQQKHTFAKIPAISSKYFCEVIAMSDKYDVFKLTTTNFIKSNYTTDGMVSHGNPYDEYKDNTSYYLLDVVNDISKQMALKKKSIISAFNDNDKITSYFSAHKDEINDQYLAGLIASLE